MFEDLTLPIAALGVVAAFIVLAIVSSMMRSRPRREAIDAGNLQAEKDVLRANHAVEIAALERRLAAAQARSMGSGESAMKLAEAESLANRLRQEVAGLQKVAEERAAQTAAVAAERDTLKQAAARVEEVTAERDKATAEIQERARTITRLREELATATNRMVRPTDPASSPSAGEMAAMVAARDVAEREAGDLRGERDTLRGRLDAATREAESARSEAEQLRHSLAAAQEAAADRDRAIEALKAGVDGGTPEAADVKKLTEALQAVEARERAANEQLSRMAYDLDQIRGSVAAHERRESEAKAKVEQREALLELRQQKIYELEAKIRELNTALREGTGGSNGDATLSRLQDKLGDVQGENDALLRELEALRHDITSAADDAAPSEAPALRRERDTLKVENETLRAAAREAEALNSAEVADLRRELRELAQKLIDLQGAPEEPKEPQEMSLADRIRAFKASRDAEKA